MKTIIMAGGKGTHSKKWEKKRSLTALLVWQFLFDDLIGRVVLGGVGVRFVVDTIRADLEVDIELLLEHIIVSTSLSR